MNILKEQYRELLINLNFLKNERFIYQDAPKPAQPVTPPTKPAGNETAEAQQTAADKQKEPTKPLTAESWDTHQNRYENHIKALPKDFVETKKTEFKSKLAIVEARYNTALSAADGNKKEAANSPAVTEGINKLLAEMRAKMSPEQRAAMEKSEEAARPQTPENKADADKKGPEGEKITDPALLKKAVDLITNKLKVQDPEMKAKLAQTISQLDFTPGQLKRLNEGKDIDLTDKQRDAILNSTGEKINDYDPKKGDMIHRLLTNLKLNKEKLGGPAAHAINDMFDTDAKPLRKYLVMKWPITEVDGKLRVKNNPITKLDDLVQYLPGDMQENFKTILNLNKGEPKKSEKEQELALKGTPKDKDSKNGTQGLEEKLWAIGEKNLKGLEDVKKLQTEIMGQINPEGKEATTPIDALVLILQLFKAIKKAMETGDWDELGDYLNDWKSVKNPKEMAKRLKDSQDAYKERLEKDPKPTLNQLLKSYINPRGDEARALFLTNAPKDKEGALSNHRSEARPLIAEHLAGQLGKDITISKIEKGTGSLINITAMKNDEKLSISVDLLPNGEFKARVQKLETKKEGDKDKEEASAYVEGKGGYEQMKNLEELKIFLDKGRKGGGEPAGTEKGKDNEPKNLDAKKTELKGKLNNLVKDKLPKGVVSPLGKIAKELYSTDSLLPKWEKGVKQKNLDNKRVEFLMSKINTADELSKIDKKMQEVTTPQKAPAKTPKK